LLLRLANFLGLGAHTKTNTGEWGWLVGCFWVFSGVGGMEGFGRFVALQAKGNFQFEYFSC